MEVDPGGGERDAANPAHRAATEHSATSIVTTMLGEFVLPAGGAVWTATVVDGLAALGFEERNARQALARLGDDGLIRSERHGRRARWCLTDAGTRLLTTGTDRIYSFGRLSEAWDGAWIVVLCPIAESRRRDRHRFRTKMAFAGYGFLTPSTAISPHADREAAANEIIDSLDLRGTAVVFRSTTGTLTRDEDLLVQAWDLVALEHAYRRFVDRLDGLAPATDLDAFASTIVLVDEWRRFPFIDPELPDGLVPDEWIGIRARELFDRRRTAWRSAAQRWFADRDAEAG